MNTPSRRSEEAKIDELCMCFMDFFDEQFKGMFFGLQIIIPESYFIPKVVYFEDKNRFEEFDEMCGPSSATEVE